MLRDARLSISQAAASAATPSPRPRLKLAAAVLLVLFRLAANAVLGAFLAGFFACSLGSALRVLGRWICGEGSFVEGAGGAIVESTKGFLLTVSPLFILLFKVRMFEHAIFVVNEAKDKKQNPARSAASHLPKVELAIVYMGSLIALASIAMWTISSAEKGSLKLRVGSVLLDIAILGASLVAGFLILPTMVILLMATRAKGMQ